MYAHYLFLLGHSLCPYFHRVVKISNNRHYRPVMTVRAETKNGDTTFMTISVGDATTITPPSLASEKQTISDSGIRLREFCRLCPKAELHAHLNGCVRETTLSELAAERGVSLSERFVGDDCGSSGSSEGVRSVGRSRGSKRLLRRSLSDCFEIFDEIRRCVTDLPALRRITREALEDFAGAGVSYLELRSTPKKLLLLRPAGDRGGDDRGGCKEGDLLCSKREYAETIVGVMRRFEAEERVRYRQEVDDHLIVGSDVSGLPPRLPLVSRYLVSVDRSKSVQEADENVDLATTLFGEGNEFVVGIDLGGNPTKNDFRDFEPSLRRAREAGMGVSVHCGEVPTSSAGSGSGPEDLSTENTAALSGIADSEAEAIVMSFCPDRLGHALLLPPPVADALLKLRVPVECCPTSNVMTLELATAAHHHHRKDDLVEGLRNHPQLRRWLDSDHPISLSTDDSGVFDTDPTREMLLMAEAFGMEEKDLQRLCLRAFEDAFVERIEDGDRSGGGGRMTKAAIREAAEEGMNGLTRWLDQKFGIERVCIDNS